MSVLDRRPAMVLVAGFQLDAGSTGADVAKW